MNTQAVHGRPRPARRRCVLYLAPQPPSPAPTQATVTQPYVLLTATQAMVRPTANTKPYYDDDDDEVIDLTKDEPMVHVTDGSVI
jgi:hypothetical protein